MSGELPMLPFVLLAVTVGAVALSYYLRKRGSAPHAEPPPSPQGDSSSRDRDSVEADHKKQVPPLPQTDLTDGPSGALT